MSTLRLTKQIRKNIVSKAVDHKFVPMESALKNKEIVLRDKIYDTVVPFWVRQKAQEFPQQNLLNKQSCMPVFGAGGCNYIFKFDSYVLFPREAESPSAYYYSTQYRVNIDKLDSSLAIEFGTFLSDKQKISTQREELSRKILSVLSSYNTYKRMAENWPEGYEFYKHYETHMTPPAIILSTTEINSILGLV